MTIPYSRLEKAFRDSTTFEEYVAQAKNHVAEMRENYKHDVLSPDEIASLSSIESTVDILAIVEDWCPDCTATVPLFARIDETIDAVHLHVLVREPGNGDVGEAFPAEDGRSHVPTYVFFDSDRNELGIFIERPAAITAILDAWTDEFVALHPDVDKENLYANLTPDLRAELLEGRSLRRRENRDLEKSEILAIIRSIVVPVSA